MMIIMYNFIDRSVFIEEDLEVMNAQDYLDIRKYSFTNRTKVKYD